MSSKTYILAGLGNPGEKYSGTRHNIGFKVADQVASRSGVSVCQQKWDAFTVKISISGVTVHIVKPMTFMNLSGKAVARFVDFYKVAIDRLIVVHDDLDMKLGRLKLVHGGGTGGHNGIRSIVSNLGEKNFYRLKIGIGRPGDGNTPEKMPVERYVLTSFSAGEKEYLQERITVVPEGLGDFFRGDPLRSMNYLNSFK